jgi:ribosomal protein L11 methyltransferase
LESPGDEDLRSLLVEELMALPVRGVEEGEGVLLVYLPPPEGEIEAVLDELRSHLQEASGVDSLPLRYRWQVHEEWSDRWQRGLGPRRITERLVVSPSWVDPQLEPGDLLITLDPGMAFGTAEHATTRGCLRLLERVVRPGQRMADVGAGSGILSIAAALLGAGRVLALEMDPWSCVAARENVRANGVEARVTVREELAGPEFLPDEAPFDGIVANIEAGVLTPLLAGFRSGLVAGGWLILSGIMAHEKSDVLEATVHQGFTFREADEEDGWWSGRFTTDEPTPAARDAAPGG